VTVPLSCLFRGTSHSVWHCSSELCCRSLGKTFDVRKLAASRC